MLVPYCCCAPPSNCPCRQRALHHPAACPWRMLSPAWPAQCSLHCYSTSRMPGMQLQLRWSLPWEVVLELRCGGTTCSCDVGGGLLDPICSATLYISACLGCNAVLHPYGSLLSVCSSTCHSVLKPFARQARCSPLSHCAAVGDKQAALRVHTGAANHVHDLLVCVLLLSAMCILGKVVASVHTQHATEMWLRRL
jgi:hypothetical protein